MTASAKHRWEMAILAALMAAAASGKALAQKTGMTDAQVEANVLRALASAPELSTQNIQSTSVYGVVTLSGNVHDEEMRTRAENLVARAEGVKKVVDEMALGDTPAPSVAAANDSGEAPAAQVLQSDGSYAPAPPEAVNQANPDQPAATADSQGYAPQGIAGAAGNYPAQRPYAGRGDSTQYAGQPGYAQATQPRYPGYSQGQDGQPPYYGPGGSGQGGQSAGMAVTVPSGATLQVRMDRSIDSNHIQPGTPFTGTVLNDVVAGGFVAVPRGAQVQGTVVDAKHAGALKGEGALALQLTGVTLAGQNFPVNSLVWERAGHDKTLTTVNSALGLGALGAVFGGLAGGGAGAAIGAGVGGAVGVGASAASPRGRVIVPPESVLTFSLAQPLAVKTVSQGEMQRLAYAAGPGSGAQPVMVRRRPYAYGPYPYPGYYTPYGYPYGYWR